MKNIKYIVFLLILFNFNVFYVNASCTNEEINGLKKITDNIKITYRYLGKIEEEEGVFDNQYEVVIKNVDDDLYISLYNDSEVLTPTNGEIVSTFNNGTWNFDFFSKKCDIKIDTIEIFIPRFNEYSLDPLCEGIDGNDFPLCGKYYEYEVSYESFEERVKHYRATYNVNSSVTDEKTDEDKFQIILNDIYNFILKYRLYIVISLIVILIILISIIVIKKKRNRGVLE